MMLCKTEPLNEDDIMNKMHQKTANLPAEGGILHRYCQNLRAALDAGPISIPRAAVEAELQMLRNRPGTAVGAPERFTL